MSKLALTDIKKKQTAILESARKNGIIIIGLFGSLVGGEDYMEGDLQFLIKLKPEKSLFDIVRLHRDIKNIFKDQVELTIHSPTEEGLKKSIDEFIITKEQCDLILSTAKSNTFDKLFNNHQDQVEYKHDDHSTLFAGRNIRSSFLFPERSNSKNNQNDASFADNKDPERPSDSPCIYRRRRIVTDQEKQLASQQQKPEKSILSSPLTDINEDFKTLQVK